MATRVTDIPRANTAEGLDLDDRELVLAFQAGEIDAYSDIFVKYRRLVAQICYRILENRDDAEEAVQETMLRVYRGLPRFNGRYQLQAWVARIATNVALDQVRARQRRPLSDSPLEPDRETGALNVAPDHEPPDELERLLDREDVRSVLGEIPDHHRDALVLREFEGRSHEEIGDALGVSPAQAKALIHRAKKSFRRAWGEDGERRGIAAFAPILLAVFRLPGLRRLAGSAREVVANASATATQVAVNVTAAPAAVQTSMSVADKVTAAALTVIVAGTATVGAVAIRRAAKPVAKPSPSVAAAPAPSTVPAVVAVVPTKARPVVRQHHSKQHAQTRGRVRAVFDAPSATPSSDPSASPSPGGSPTPPPPPPPAPAWSGSFSTSVGLNVAHLREVSQQVTPQGDDQMLFMQTAHGALVGPKGTDIGDVYLDFGGVVGPTSGRLSSLWLFIDTPEGRYSYAADASLSSVNHARDGSSVYVLSGGYALNSLPATLKTLVPHDGAIEIRLSFWQDGSLFATGVSMSEA